MGESYSIKLTDFVCEFQLKPVWLPDNIADIQVTAAEVDRPGLALAGFFDIFESDRIQLIGNAEHTYLSNMDEADRRGHIAAFVAHRPVCIVVTHELTPFSELISECGANGVPLYAARETTSTLMAAMFASLNVHLAPRITRHGVLVDVYGEGLLLLGDSGVGKSETAIELVKRGHRLIADDAVEIKKVSAKSLVGTAPEIIRHYVELRGIGIIDVCRIFGMGAVNETMKIDLVINLEQWVQGKMYDRFGLDEEKIDILGIELPCITVPVRPGRNLAIIIEIAAMNDRQKKMGYNTAEEFNKKLLAMMSGEEE